MYLELVFYVSFLYFFNLHFPITELGTPSFLLSPPRHLSLSDKGGQSDILPETDTHLTWELVLGWVCCIAVPTALGSCPAVEGTVWWQLLPHWEVSPAVPFQPVLVRAVPLKLHVHFASVSLKNKAWFLKHCSGEGKGE